MIAFLKKELREAARTNKLTVIGLVFLLFGVMNPLGAKFLPEIVAAALPEGMMFTIPEPTALDSWGQFFKNVSQMGLIVAVVLFGGVMASELSRGTLLQILTKGLSRKTVILTKYLAVSLLWTAAYVLCFLVTYAYTAYYWPSDVVRNLAIAVSALWLFGMLLLAIPMLGGVLFKGSYGSLLLTGAFVALLYVLTLVPALRAYNPIVLASGGMELLAGQKGAGDIIGPATVSLAMTAAFLTGAILTFNKKAL